MLGLVGERGTGRGFLGGRVEVEVEGREVLEGC